MEAVKVLLGQPIWSCWFELIGLAEVFTAQKRLNSILGVLARTRGTTTTTFRGFFRGMGRVRAPTPDVSCTHPSSDP
jgi:hypothetical protein